MTAIAERRATAQDVYDWLDALLQREPEFWRDARALREDRSRFVTRRALDLARVVLGNPAAGAERAGGRS